MEPTLYKINLYYLLFFGVFSKSNLLLSDQGTPVLQDRLVMIWALFGWGTGDICPPPHDFWGAQLFCKKKDYKEKKI